MNAGSNWANTMISAAVGLLLAPIMLGKLGDTAYGVWALLAYGLSYPIILDSSFVLSLNRFVAYYQNDPKEVNRFVSASFVILTALAVLTVTLAILLSFVISRIFAAIPEGLEGDAQTTCILVGVTLALKMLVSSFSGALQGYQNYTCYNAVVITGNILRAILVVALLMFWKSIVVVQLGFMIAAGTSALLMFFVARKTIPGLKVDVRQVTKGTLRELLKYTVHSLARSGSLIAMYNTMTLLVGWAGTAADVTVYTIACKIPIFVRGLLSGAQNVFLPAVANLYSNGQLNKVKTAAKKGTQISCVLICACCILLFVFTKEILIFWLRRPVSIEMVQVMRLLLVSIVPMGIFGIWMPVLVGMGHLRWPTIMAITLALSAIFLELIFLLQGIGTIAMAPAIAQVIMLWICRGLWLPTYGLYKSGIHPYEYFKDSLFEPMTATLVSIAALWILYSIVPKDSIHWSVMFIASAVIVTASFTAISLRTEAADLAVAIRRKFLSKKEQLV